MPRFFARRCIGATPRVPCDVQQKFAYGLQHGASGGNLRLGFESPCAITGRHLAKLRKKLPQEAVED
jgi:hypothetical protein